MSRIRGRDTTPELQLRKSLWAAGIRYRLRSKLPGRPDLVFARARVVVFVDGCFWHGCPEHYNKPESRADFWHRKHLRNAVRDREVNELLKSQGWMVLRFWEHELKTSVAGVSALIMDLVVSKSSAIAALRAEKTGRYAGRAARSF
jgi:DNA mismatch endonuclease (patch repair protein)